MACEDLLNEVDCTFYGCHWYNGSCHEFPPICEDLNNESDCLGNGCWWYNGSCHTTPPSGVFGSTGTSRYVYKNVKGWVAGSKFQTGSVGGLGESMTVLIQIIGGDREVVCGIYDSNLDLVAQTEVRIIPDSGTTAWDIDYATWETFYFPTPPPVLDANTEYILVVWANYQNFFEPGYYALVWTDNDPASNLWGPEKKTNTNYVLTLCENSGVSGCFDPGNVWWSWDSPYASRNLAIYCTYLPFCVDFDNEPDCLAAGCYWYDGSCHDTPAPVCSDYLTEPACLAGECHWYNGVCHDLPPATCEELLDEYDCLAYQCEWYNGACHTNPPATCEELLDEYSCLAYECYWHDGACHSVPPSCEEVITEAECIAVGCFWYDGACHAESLLYEWIGPAHLGITDVFATIDAYILSMEPYGTADQVKIYYSFIRGGV